MSRDFREAFRDRDTWESLTADPDVALEALDWLTDTVAHVSQQLSDAKADLAGTRLPDDEYRDLMDWRAGALNFRRLCESRSEESSTNQLNRLRAGLWRLCERYGGATPMAAEVRALMAEVEA